MQCTNKLYLFLLFSTKSSSLVYSLYTLYHYCYCFMILWWWQYNHHDIVIIIFHRLRLLCINIGLVVSDIILNKLIITGIYLFFFYVYQMSSNYHGNVIVIIRNHFTISFPVVADLISQTGMISIFCYFAFEFGKCVSLWVEHKFRARHRAII